MLLPQTDFVRDNLENLGMSCLCLELEIGAAIDEMYMGGISFLEGCYSQS